MKRSCCLIDRGDSRSRRFDRNEKWSPSTESRGMWEDSGDDSGVARCSCATSVADLMQVVPKLHAVWIDHLLRLEGISIYPVKQASTRN